MKQAISNREQILKYALRIEEMTSVFLAARLGIKDRLSSRTLGTKGSTLSLNTKVDLLIDIALLNANNKNKYQAFMELRNQLMHNSLAESFEMCYHFIPQTEKFVLKNYPQPKGAPKESQLYSASMELASDVQEITVRIIEKLIEQERNGEFKRPYIPRL